MSEHSNFEFSVDNKRYLAGPETVVFLYYGVGADRYNHALIERPDARDPFVEPDMPSPKQYCFDYQVIRVLGGLASPSLDMDPNQVKYLADVMMQTVGWKAEIVIAEFPSSVVVDRYERNTGIKAPDPRNPVIDSFLQQLDNVDNFVQAWNPISEE